MHLPQPRDVPQQRAEVPKVRSKEKVYYRTAGEPAFYCTNPSAVNWETKTPETASGSGYGGELVEQSWLGSP